MERSKRRRLGAQGWRDLLGRFELSGQSIEAFCRREAVSTASFYRWRTRLRSSVPATLPRSGVEPAAAFVDLGTLMGGGAGRLELKLDLGGGVVLQLVRG